MTARRLVPATLIAALLALAPAARADSFLVDTNQDVRAGNGADCSDADDGTPCSVRDALAAAAASAEDDRIDVPAGTYVLDGAELQTQGAFDVTLAGAGAAKTTLDADDRSRVLLLDADTTIAGMTVRGGRSPVQGAGIQANLGTLVLRDSVVEGNWAGDGGGIAILADGASTIERSAVRGNRATFAGGAVWTAAASQLTIADSTIAANRAEPTADGAATGGGIYANGDVTLRRAAILENVAAGVFETGNGGGLVALAGLEMSDSSVSRNGARGVEASGGGVYLSSFVPQTIRGSTIAANTVDATTNGANGGGIVQFAGPLELTNSTISGNRVSATADGRGGGATLTDATLTNVTMTGNSASGSRAAAGTLESFDSLVLRNTIVAGGAPANCDAPLLSATNSIDADGTCAFGAGAGNRSGVDPRLGPLAPNGGLTPTHGLLPGSPAVDTGTAVGAPATDQRGVARPQGSGFDIGAFELVPTPAPPDVEPPAAVPPAAGPPDAETAADTVAPVFTRRLRLSPRAFRTRTRVRYSLSEAAAVRFTIRRRATGRRVGGRCVKRTRRNRGRRHCIRYVTMKRRAFRRSAQAGANRVRLRRRGLAPGRYRLVAIAVDPAGNRSRPSSAGFRIRRAR